jgi:hypothetical protein
VSLPANIYWLADADQLREQIKKSEALAYAAWILAPCFIHQSAIDRMGLTNIDKALETFRIALRDFLCIGLEQRLEDLEAHPVPTAAEVRRMKPPIEMLIAAQEQVAALENYILKMRALASDTPGFELIEGVMIPQVEMQLASAKSYLTSIQTAMEASDETDVEADQSPMSSKQHPDKAGTAGEANLPTELL